jgi:hypothetical protein
MTTGAFPRPWRVIEHAESRCSRAAQGRGPADGREFRHATGSECWSAPWGGWGPEPGWMMRAMLAPPVSTSRPSARPCRKRLGEKVARFRQVNKEQPYVHHDALESPGGEIVLLTGLCQGQNATVLQLPSAPRTEEEAEEQTRVAVVA